MWLDPIWVRGIVPLLASVSLMDSRAEGVIDLLDEHLAEGVGSVRGQAALLEVLGQPSKASGEELSHRWWTLPASPLPVTGARRRDSHRYTWSPRRGRRTSRPATLWRWSTTILMPPPPCAGGRAIRRGSRTSPTTACRAPVVARRDAGRTRCREHAVARQATRPSSSSWCHHRGPVSTRPRRTSVPVA